jgi:hypothetical protein
MQLANAMLALAGDLGNTVPKLGITPSEVAVLRFIHGNDAVIEIDVLDVQVERTHREERDRLTEAYGAYEGEQRRSRAVEALFPGAAARVFETFDEMDLDDSLFKADRVRRVAPVAPVAAPKAAKRGKKAAEEAAPEPEQADEPEDGIEDMNDVMG